MGELGGARLVHHSHKHRLTTITQRSSTGEVFDRSFSFSIRAVQIAHGLCSSYGVVQDHFEQGQCNATLVLRQIGRPRSRRLLPSKRSTRLSHLASFTFKCDVLDVPDVDNRQGAQNVERHLLPIGMDDGSTCTHLCASKHASAGCQLVLEPSRIPGTVTTQAVDGGHHQCVAVWKKTLVASMDMSGCSVVRGHLFDTEARHFSGYSKCSRTPRSGRAGTGLAFLASSIRSLSISTCFQGAVPGHGVSKQVCKRTISSGRLNGSTRLHLR